MQAQITLKTRDLETGEVVGVSVGVNALHIDRE